jgi:fructoselysine-6-P-deglycase FrlB-like protein
MPLVLYHEWPALRQANVVLNSRSGETAEIVKLAMRLKDASIPFLAITNEPPEHLSTTDTAYPWVNTHKDDLVSINVVGTMLVTLVGCCGDRAARPGACETGRLV